jgi:hypothetical protein
VVERGTDDDRCKPHPLEVPGQAVVAVLHPMDG